MSCAGVLLTGGASRRMGYDKSALPAGEGTTLAGRTAALLAAQTSPTLELGPGRSGLPWRPDDGSGPLGALASAADLWASLPDTGHVVVLATDLPRLTSGFVAWLAAHPSPGAIVPVDAGRRQPLCARYPVAALRTTPVVFAAAERSLTAWLATLELHDAGPEEWAGPAGRADALLDVDTPADYARLTAVRRR